MTSWAAVGATEAALSFQGILSMEREGCFAAAETEGRPRRASTRGARVVGMGVLALEPRDRELMAYARFAGLSGVVVGGIGVVAE